MGVAWGGALLSKYHAVFLPAGVVLFALVEPTAPPNHPRVGPYLAVALGLVIFSPVVVWNARHDWVSFAFQAGRASDSGGIRFQPLSLLAAIGGQAAYLFPWVWIALLRVLFGRLRAFRRGDEITPSERFLVCQAITPLMVFTAVACFRPVLPHWTLVGYLSIFPLVGREGAERRGVDRAKARRRFVILAAIPVVVMGAFAVQFETGVLNRVGLPIDADPTADLYGWDQIARDIEQNHLTDRPGTFVFASTWFVSGQVGFATRYLGVPVLCLNYKDAHNFAFWSRPDDWLGHDGILVSIDDARHEPGYVERCFERIDPPIALDRLFRCVRQVLPFPFGVNREPSRP